MCLAFCTKLFRTHTNSTFIQWFCENWTRHWQRWVELSLGDIRQVPFKNWDKRVTFKSSQNVTRFLMFVQENNVGSATASCSRLKRLRYMLALCVLRMMHSGMLWFRPVRNMISYSTYLQTCHTLCVCACAYNVIVI